MALAATARYAIAALVLTGGVLVAQPALAVCGDAQCNFGETCGTCPEDCCPQPSAPCGDGVCEDGLESCSSCAFDCCAAGSCGDGTINGGEECDDGNADAGDGCDASCALEVKLMCSAGPNFQHAVWLRAGDASGAPEVTYWENLGRRANFAAAAETTEPEVVVDVINGHPVLRFEPQDGLEEPDQFGGFASHAIIAVIRASGAAAAEGHLVAPRNVGNHRLTVNPGPDVAYQAASTGPGVVNADQPHIITALVDVIPFALDVSVTTELMVDGFSGGSGAEILANYMWSTATGMEIGNDNSNLAGFHGDIAELIVFKRGMSPDDLAQIHTYLAVKYGIALPTATYQDASGTELYGHDEYPLHIAGVGRNDCSGLLQEESVSATDGTLMVDASGAALADGQYLLWGSNAATTSTFDMVSELGCSGQRVSRIYRFGNKGPGGAVGPVRVEFDLNAFGLDIATLNAVRLLVDDDLDFTTDATSYLGAEVAPGVFEFTGVVPTDGAYFTVFACPESTCGNGLREGSEACDDNNTDPGDGCDASCQREVTLLCEPGAEQHGFWVRSQGLAAGSAVGWNDVGGPNNLSVAPNQTAPPVALGVGNGNNAIFLSGTAGLSNPTFDGGFQSHTILMAALQNAAGSGRVLLGSNGDPPETALSLDGDALSYGGDIATMTANRPFVVTARTDVAGDDVTTELFLSGVGTGGSTSNTPGYLWSADGGLNLGNNQAGTASLEGAIGEVVMFERALSAQEQAIVETYLAIKFGLNLPADGFVGTDGTALYGHAGHANAIAGVARNDCQQLDQQQGTSSDDGLLTVTADSLTNGQYALFGHDGAAASTVPAGVFGACNEVRLERTYRAGTGGATNVPVRLVFNTGVLGGAFVGGTVRLLVDADGDFSSGASVIAPAGSGAGTHFFDVAIDHGQYITVVAYNESPVANDFSTTVSASGWVFIPLTGQYTVIDGAEPDPEFAVSGSGVYFVDQPTDGIIYQANTSSGSDTLNYTVCSVNSCCDSGTVSLTLDINTAPEANDDSYLVNQDTPQLLPVLNNDTDAEGDPLTPTVTVQPTSGTATVQPSGEILYAPNGGFFGADSFQYEVCDDSGECSLLPATVTLTVNGAPFAGTDGIVAQDGATVIVTVSGNDSDPEGDALTWSLATQPGSGTAVHLGGAQFQYTAPVSGGTDTSFTYQVCDTHGACTAGTVDVNNINQPNQPPNAVEDQVTTPEGQGITVDVLANDGDPNNGDILSINQLTAGPSVGIATFDPVFGTITYTPPAGFTGIVTVTYEVCDDKVPALCDTADLEVTVDGPTCGDGTCNGTELCTTCPGDCGSCVCGNGAIEADEQCDDGNTTPYDGCDENCQKYDICGAGVDPADAFWVRADWIPGADGPITFWDAIGSDYDLTPVGRTPRFDTSTPPTYFNGHPALNAHPTSRDGMYNADFDVSGGHTTFLMTRRWITSGGIPLMDGGRPNWNYALYNFGNSLRWRYQGSNTYSIDTTTNNRPYIHGYTTVDNGSNMTGTFFVDGVSQSSVTRSGDGSWMDRGITIADYYNSSGQPTGRFYGHVAEAIVCPAELDATQRNAIETYMSVKYGVPIPGDNYVGVDGADLFDGPPAFDTFVVGIGKQDRQGLNQTETSSWIVDWLDISTGSMANNQYALVGGDVASNAWLASSPVAGYDRVSETTYYYNSRGSGGAVGNVTLTIIVPFSLSGYSAGQFFLLHDNISNLGNPTAIAASGITVGTRAVTFTNVTIPDGHFFRIGAVFPATCSDGVDNGLESDIDCGGNCAPCPAGNDCGSGDDCESFVCTGGVCQQPSCSDGVRNGAEEEVDCGPGCVACGCVTYMGNEANTCNNLDEDCDGETDENYDDGIACTASFCSGGIANNIPNNISCNDFNGCTADICDVGSGGCVNINDNSGTPDASQADNNPCTDLRCVNGATVNVVDNTNIPDDGLFCTTQTCSNGSVQTSILPGYCLYNGECVAHGFASTQAPCGVCDTSKSQTEVQTDIINESFESGTAGWSFAMQNGGATGVRWQRTDYTASDGNYSLYFGSAGYCQWELLWGWLPWYVCYPPTYDVGQRVQGTATGPTITVSNTVVDLTFDLLADVEYSTWYDVVYFEVNNGSGWTTIWSNGYSTFGWEEQTVSLAAYAGQSVQIRFRFDTRDGDYNDYQGVWVDNIQMRAACCFTSSDCDDSDSCTVDFCSSDQGCRHINTCVTGCDAKKNILLVLDYSGSMTSGDGTGQSKWESAVDGIDAAMAQFEPLMNTGLLLFPSQTDGWCGVNSVPSSTSWMWPSTVVPPVARAPEFWFGTPRSTLVGHLNSLWPPGLTPMAAGVRRAADVYNSGHPSINTDSANYVLLISDGAESCGSGDAAAEVLNLYNQDIETFVIGFGSGVDSAVLEAAAINGGHAKSIGEAFYSASNEGEMTDAMVEILLEITAEQCDGIDNDCNGIVDDGVPEQTCFVTCNGVNYPGVSLCTNGSYSACQLPNIVETCDGVDNNCNGQTDEGFSLGASCTVGVGACQNTGTMVCDGTGTGTTCSAIPGVPVTETCDTVDNDCDGSIDENFPLGQPCDGSDDDLCATGTWTCAADGTAECVNETESYTETCDGVDNNCDGVPDDGFGLGTPCDGPDSDFCNEGVLECEPATLGVICSDTSGDSVEICNGIDDDCDGKIDEGFDVGFPCDGPDADLCLRGEKVCSADGSTTVCADDSPNSDEVCNGFDDDCDGSTDEQDAGGCTVYYADNDQDGFGAGPGQCLCAPTGPFTSTSDTDCDDTRNDVYPGSVEVCDGVDQDCDGTTDENPQTDSLPWIIDCYTGPDGTEDVGICTGGTTQCNGASGFDPTCVGEVTPQVEACDDLDNDCDGTTDEENANGCTTYYRDVDNDTYGTGPARCLCDPEGEWDNLNDLDCNDDNAMINPDAVEVCDGIDNECDGFIDEDPTDSSLKLTQSCYTGPPLTLGIGTCTSGIETCDSSIGDWGPCEDEVVPTLTESCDGLDTDCDGIGDADEPGGGDPDTEHACSYDPACAGLSCYCFNNTQTGTWACIAD